MKSKKIKEQINAEADKAQAILNIAEKEDRELTKAEQTEWDAIMSKDGGTMVKLSAELESAEKLEDEIKRLAALRSPSVSAATPVVVASTAIQAGPQYPLPRVINPKLKAFKGENRYRDAYESGQWFMALTGNQSAIEFCGSHGIRLAQTEGTASEGGYTVPDPLASAIIDIRELYGVARKVCRIMPMTADTLNVPRRTGGLTVKYPGEATAIVESDKTWGTVALTAVKRATLTKCSQELRADSIINVIDDLASEIGQAFGRREDAELLNGDGGAGYGSVTGLITDVGAAGVVDAASGSDTWAELILGELLETVALLPEQYHPGAQWIVSRAFHAQVMERLALAAGISTNVSFVDGLPQTRFIGYPVQFSDQMPAEAASTICALFGDFSESVLLGDRGDTAVSLSDQFAFDEDVITVRGTARWDINVFNDGDGSNPGGYVALKTAA